MPLFSVLPIITAVFLARVLDRSRTFFSFLLLPVVLLSLIQVANLDVASFQPWVQNRRLPVRFTPLIRLLREKNIRYLYVDDWIAYRLIFETGEEIICSVYPPAINDRYPPYTKLVGRAESAAYIIMEARSSGFEEMLGTMNICGYEKEELAPFVLFYDLYRDR